MARSKNDKNLKIFKKKVEDRYLSGESVFSLYISVFDKSQSEIARKLDVSRQYINSLRDSQSFLPDFIKEETGLKN